MSSTTDGAGSSPWPKDERESRTRRLAGGIVTAVGARGVGAVAPLLMIPLMLPALGKSLFGVWMTITALTSMLIWADLGLGNGLMTRLSAHLALEDYDSARRDVHASYLLVTMLAGVLILAAGMSWWFLDWPSLLNVSPEFGPQATRMAIVCLALFVLNVPLGLIQRIQYAAGQVALSSLFTALGPILSLAATAFAIHLELDPVWIVACATVGLPIANMAATIYFFSTHRELAPRPRQIPIPIPQAKSMLRIGGLFVAITMCSAIAINADSVVIARALGPEAVTSYSIPLRVLSALGLLINLVNLPLWPANARALAQGDVAWVRRTTLRMVAASSGFVALATVAMLVGGDQVVSALTHGTESANFGLILALGAWWILISATSPLSMVQNAAGVLRPQLVGWVVFLLCSVPAKYVAASNLGLACVPLAGACCYACTVLPGLIIGYRVSLHRASQATGPERP